MSPTIAAHLAAMAREALKAAVAEGRHLGTWVFSTPRPMPLPPPFCHWGMQELVAETPLRLCSSLLCRRHQPRRAVSTFCRAPPPSPPAGILGEWLGHLCPHELPSGATRAQRRRHMLRSGDTGGSNGGGGHGGGRAARCCGPHLSCDGRWCEGFNVYGSPRECS